jgi:CubicO group peptidase (beta-lactamase class C family)
MQGKSKILFCFFIAIGFLQLNSCEVGRFVVFNVADINDYKIFPSRKVENNDSKFCFATCNEMNDGRIPQKIILHSGRKQSFESFLNSKKSVAFLVIHNDSIVYEKYFSSYNEASVVPSFSVAKSVTSILIGCAIDDGYIRSVDQPVSDFIPELKKNGFDKVTIKNLLQMTSGIRFKEGYFNFFNSTPQYYYGINIRKKIINLHLKLEPGKEFKYSSGNAELLGLVLERALRTKKITEYLEEKIWQPLGMEYNATWSIDRKRYGIEKTFCCLNARARDYAKLGRLYLNKGNWNGIQIVSENWINESVKIDTTGGSAWNYQYQWWIASEKGDYYARGMLGQFVYVNPLKKLIIVRLGEKSGGVDWPKCFMAIAERFDEKNIIQLNPELRFN